MCIMTKDVYHQNFLFQLSYKVYHDNRDTLNLCVANPQMIKETSMLSL